jgi:hypothetical protein
MENWVKSMNRELKERQTGRERREAEVLGKLSTSTSCSGLCSAGPSIRHLRSESCQSWGCPS